MDLRIRAFKFFSYTAIILICVYRILIIINPKLELAIGETNNIWNSLNSIKGKSIYTDPEKTPFEIFQYTPISQLILVFVGKIFNFSIKDFGYNTLLVGRMLSFIYNCLTVFIIYKLNISTLKQNSWNSFLITLLSMILFTHLSFAVRPDALAFLSIILAFFFFMESIVNERKNFQIYAGLILGFSFFIKQDSFLIIFSFGFCLLIYKKWLELLQLTISFLFSIGILFLIFIKIYGEVFIQSVIGGVSLGYDLEQAISVFKRFIELYTLIPIIGLTIITFYIFKLKKLQQVDIILAIVTISFFILGIGTTFKEGSWVNYYLPFVIFTITLAFQSLKYFSKNSKNLIIVFLLLSGFYFLFLQYFHYTSPYLKYYKSKKEKYEKYIMYRRIKKEIGNNKLFTFDKDLKILFYDKTLFPNTEYYHVSPYSFNSYMKLNEYEKLSYYIYDENLNKDQLSTLQYYKVRLENYKKINSVFNFTIYKDTLKK